MRIGMLSALWGALVAVTPVRADPVPGYFHLFPYAKEFVDSGNGVLKESFKFLMGESEVVVSEHRHLVLQVALFLLPNYEYVLSYVELVKVRDDAAQPWRYEVDPRTNICPKIVRGHWTAPIDRLVADAGFEADRAVVDGQPAVMIDFVSTVGTPQTQGAQIVLDYAHSDVGLDAFTKRLLCRP